MKVDLKSFVGGGLKESSMSKKTSKKSKTFYKMMA
jgi:hypothetical protein